MHVESGIIFVTVTRRYCFRQLLLTTRIVVFRNKKKKKNIAIPDARGEEAATDPKRHPNR